MLKTEYSFLTFIDNVFLFYQPNHEPRELIRLKKPAIFGMSTNPGPDFTQTLVRVINEIAAEGWEFFLVSSSGFVWYFKRSNREK